ncbi:hypothetical protein SAMN03159463_02345 [Mesorhizobium sp. NFR06]|nr:hypothetical protein SAMN03159463_02345 [Mesorhizobium sp. NFR06]
MRMPCADDRPRSTAERVFQVRSATLLWANLEYFRANCRTVRRHRFGGDDERLGEWILQQFAFVSAPHTSDNALHRAIPVTDRQVTAVRPPQYDRSIVIEVDGSWYDIKGGGLPPGRVPAFGEYSTGLFHAHLAVTELYTSILLSEIFRRDGDGLVGVVSCLAIIQLPIMIKLSSRLSIMVPVVLYVRPHVSRHRFGGDIDPLDSEESIYKLGIELFLRGFGITSCQADRDIAVGSRSDGMPVTQGNRLLTGDFAERIQRVCRDTDFTLPAVFEFTNVQIGRRRRKSKRILLIDLEHYEYKSAFRKHLSQVCSLGNKTAIEIVPSFNPSYIKAPTNYHPGAHLLQYEARAIGDHQGNFRRVTWCAIDTFLQTAGPTDCRSNILRLLRQAAWKPVPNTISSTSV